MLLDIALRNLTVHLIVVLLQLKCSVYISEAITLVIAVSRTKLHWYVRRGKKFSPESSWRHNFFKRTAKIKCTWFCFLETNTTATKTEKKYNFLWAFFHNHFMSLAQLWLQVLLEAENSVSCNEKSNDRQTRPLMENCFVCIPLFDQIIGK